MKKIINLLLGITLLANLTACGGSSSSSQNTSDSTVEESESQSTTVSEGKSSTTLSIQSQELYNSNGIKITLNETEINPNNISLPLLIENESDKSITVQVRNVSVNNVMYDALISSEVASGKKANDSLDFYNYDSRASFDSVSSLEFSFYIFDSDTWDEIEETDPIVISTSDSSYVYEPSKDGETVLDENGILIVYQGFDDSWSGTNALFYVENNTDQPICIQTRDSSINGFMIDSIMSTEVMPGKKAYTDMSFLSTDLEENNISIADNFENMEFSFYIFNDDTWDTILESSTITVTSK